ncbi:hypothetical protein D3C80_1916780 [compost metagenome]
MLGEAGLIRFVAGVVRALRRANDGKMLRGRINEAFTNQREDVLDVRVGEANADEQHRHACEVRLEEW